MAQPLPTLIKDISLTLTVAGAVVIVAQWIGVPLVVAYLFSGMIVGPSFSFFPTVVEIDQVRVLSELGILFLLFGLGLEFSFRKLFRLGFGVLIICVIEVLGAVFLGYYIASWLGLEGVQRIVFGFIIAISSTGVIVKLLQEKKLLKLGFAQAVVGILIVEDLFAIIFLLLLAVLKEPSIAAISAEIGLLFSLSTVWLVGGTIILPIIVKKIAPYLTDEVLVVSSLGFCLGVVLLAANVGVSSALAAFLCGSVLAETDLQHRIEEITRSIRQFFTAIFFVSMGMLVNPNLILANWQSILIVVASVMTIKIVLLSLSSMFTGRNITDSVRIGVLMSQIGEFSIIIASLAVAKGFLPRGIEEIVVGSAAVLILITGIVSKFELALAEKFENILPSRLISLNDRYRYALSHFERNHSLDKKERKSRRLKLIQNAAIVGAIFFVTKFIMISAVTNPIHELVAFMIVTLMSAPFLYSMSGISRITTATQSRLYTRSLSAKRVSVEQITRLFLTIIFYMLVAFIVLPDLYTLLFVALVGMILSFLFSKQLHKANTWVFKRLANEDKALELEDALPRGGPWDENLVAITVHPFAMVVDKTLAEIDLRNQWGVNVIFHQRAERRLVAPPADTKLYPADVLLLMGSSEKLEQVERIFSSESCLERTEDLQQAFIIKQVRVEPNSAWDNKPLADLDLQNSLRAVIVAIERGSQQIRAPQANTIIMAGDIIWLAMDKSRLDILGLFTSTMVSEQEIELDEVKA